jgi:hypothetical protein
MDTATATATKLNKDARAPAGTTTTTKTDTTTGVDKASGDAVGDDSQVYIYTTNAPT